MSNVLGVIKGGTKTVIGGGGSGASSADGVSYDNTTSGLNSTNVQDAIDEIAGGGSGDVSDVQFYGTSIVDSGVADLSNALSYYDSDNDGDLFLYMTGDVYVGHLSGANLRIAEDNNAEVITLYGDKIVAEGDVHLNGGIYQYSSQDPISINADQIDLASLTSNTDVSINLPNTTTISSDSGNVSIAMDTGITITGDVSETGSLSLTGDITVGGEISFGDATIAADSQDSTKIDMTKVYIGDLFVNNADIDVLNAGSYGSGGAPALEVNDADVTISGNTFLARPSYITLGDGINSCDIALNGNVTINNSDAVSINLLQSLIDTCENFADFKYAIMNYVQP